MPACHQEEPIAAAFLDLTVAPMDRERLLPNQTVVVVGDRIVTLGPVEEIPVPAQAIRIDGGGAYLMPGLADMHVHLGHGVDLALFLASGVTTVRNMWGRPEHVALRNQADRGEVLGPAIVTAGPILDAPPTSYTAIVTVADAERAVAEQQAAGYDFIKVYNNLAPEVYEAILATAERLGMPVAGHVPRPVGLERALAAGQRSIEHLSGYISPTGRGHLPGTETLPKLAAITREAGAWNCPTLVLREQQLPEAIERLTSRADMRFLPKRVINLWQQSWAEDRARAAPEDWATMREANRRRRQLTRALHEAGARLLLGTDTYNAGVLPGFAIHQELRLLVEAGLTPYAALRAGTADAAEFLGTPDDFGIVAPGARADLLLLAGDPLTDVRHVAHPLGVMARGQWLPHTRLEAMLEAAAVTDAV